VRWFVLICKGRDFVVCTDFVMGSLFTVRKFVLFVPCYTNIQQGGFKKLCFWKTFIIPN
jgi:hypothetical protein